MKIDPKLVKGFVRLAIKDFLKEEKISHQDFFINLDEKQQTLYANRLERFFELRITKILDQSQISLFNQAKVYTSSFWDILFRI